MPCTGVRRFRLWCHIYSLYPARAVSRRRLGWVRLLPAPQGVGPPPPARSRAEPRRDVRRRPRSDACTLFALLAFASPHAHCRRLRPRRARWWVQHNINTTSAQGPHRGARVYRTSVSIERALRNEHAPGIICFYYAPHDRPAAAAYWTDALPLDAKSGVVGRHTPSR